jgi:hypothetical protein
MEATSDDKKVIYRNSAHSHQTGLAHVLIDQTIFIVDVSEDSLSALISGHFQDNRISYPR